MPAVQHRPAVDARLRVARRRARCTTSPAAATCSRVSAPRASTSTSAPSSTSATCGRSSNCTTQLGLNVPSSRNPRPGVNATKAVNVHSIAIQIPKTQLTAKGSTPTDASKASSVIGVWTTASRRKVGFFGTATATAATTITASGVGPFSQVSRLGNPLFNEVLVPMERKDYWNTQPPCERQPVRRRRAAPGARATCSRAVPGRVPEPRRARTRRARSRADLVAILLTGIPTGVVPGLPELGRFDAGRHAAPEHGDPADDELAQQHRPDRRRPGRLPERPARVRRRVHDRAARASRARPTASSTPTFTPDGAASAVTDGLTTDADRPDRRGHGEVPARVPVPRDPAQRLRHPGPGRREHVMRTPITAHAALTTRSTRAATARWCSTSAATSARSCCTRRTSSRAWRSTSSARGERPARDAHRGARARTCPAVTCTPRCTRRFPPATT